MDIQNTLHKAQDLSYGWVFYRKPGDGEIHFTSGPVVTVQAGRKIQPGFCVCSFEKQFFQVAFEVDEVIAASDLEQLNFAINSIPLQTSPEDKKVFTSSVDKAIRQFESGTLQKVVLSRTSKLTLPEKLSVFQLYSRLVKTYPDAFVYLLFLPGFGLWMGCTPELLLRTKGSSIETMSLAGTGKTPDDFSAKEIAEQEYVSAFITDTLAPFSTSVSREKVSTKKAGEIYHLCTQIKAEKKAKTKVYDLVYALHPTPAVCGTPKDKALDFIHANEPHKRHLYSGFLGPVKSEDDASLFVNLRCMQIDGVEALLYAGAGIVAGSDPEAEWQETSQKMDTLRRVIFSRNGGE